MNLLASDNDTASFSLTGVLLHPNYVAISYDDLRKANAKMIELKYEKEINQSLREIIIEDSIRINMLKSNIEVIEVNHKEEVKTLKNKFYISTGCGAACFVLLVLSLL